MKQLPDKFSVYASYISQKQKELCGGNTCKVPGYYFRFELLNKDYGHASSSYLISFNLRKFNIKHEFTCDEFRTFFEEETISTLPEEYIVETKNGSEVNECGTFMNNLGRVYPRNNDFSHWNYCIKLLNADGWDIFNDIPTKYKHLRIFTFEEWKKLINKKQKETMKTRKIIGYRVPVDMFKNSTLQKKDSIYVLVNSEFYKPETNCPSQDYWLPKELVETWEPVYEEEYKVGDWVLLSNKAGGWGSFSENVNNKILQITKIDLEDRKGNGGRFYFNNERTVGKEIVRKATEQEIKKAQEQIVDMGNFKLKIKDNKVYHNIEDITNYVLSLGKWYESIPKRFGSYDFQIQNIILSKTGCENNQSYINDWLTIYNKIK